MYNTPVPLVASDSLNNYNAMKIVQIFGRRMNAMDSKLSKTSSATEGVQKFK